MRRTAGSVHSQPQLHLSNLSFLHTSLNIHSHIICLISHTHLLLFIFTFYMWTLCNWSCRNRFVWNSLFFTHQNNMLYTLPAPASVFHVWKTVPLEDDLCTRMQITFFNIWASSLFITLLDRRRFQIEWFLHGSLYSKVARQCSHHGQPLIHDTENIQNKTTWDHVYRLQFSFCIVYERLLHLNTNQLFPLSLEFQLLFL
jgi:hypothetical protein